jgi:hypothetical protein
MRDRKINQQRFSCNTEQLKTLGEALIKMADSTEEDYT